VAISTEHRAEVAPEVVGQAASAHHSSATSSSCSHEQLDQGSSTVTCSCT